jgi:hypothetical protein
MGESAQLNFAPKNFGRILANLSPNQLIFGWTLDKICPNRKKIAHKFLGENLLRGFARFRAYKYICVRHKLLAFRFSKNTVIVSFFQIRSKKNRKTLYFS